MPRFTFFIGKGGVGKTTVSSAYALHRAAGKPDKRFLLLSSDPAHSLGDVLQRRVGDRAVRLNSALWARQLDAGRQIRSFLAEERPELLALLSKGSFFTAEEIEPLLDSSLPGMAEVAALIAVQKLLASSYDEVIIDTAPMGHAIRLFQMPEHFARFLDVLETAAARDQVLARHFQGQPRREPAVERWTRMVENIRQALSREGSRLVLVTTPEPFSLKQAARAAEAFGHSGAHQQIAGVVLNRVVTGASACAHCDRRAEQTVEAQKFLQRQFSPAPLFPAPDPGCPLLGIDTLRVFGAHVFGGRKLPKSILKTAPKVRQIQLEAVKWPRLSTPLTLTFGKGGVGKTTISAALAFHHRQAAKREPVTICSIDPAPSLDDIFLAKVGDTPQPVLHDGKLLAAEFDAVAEFQRWADGLRRWLREAMTSSERGVHIDVSLDRRFLLALLDVVPPGVDELFATFRILNLLDGGGRVVIDMAPTGHALEVLRTPARLLSWTRLLLKTLAAYRKLPMARDAAVEIARLSQSVRAVAELLRDSRRSSVVVVTLPEPLPNYETHRLLRSLRALDAPVRALVINRVLPAERSACERCKRAIQWQAFSLAQLTREARGMDMWIAPEADRPIAGTKPLREFTGELYRLR